MTDDEIAKICTLMKDDACKLMLFFDMLRQRGVGFTGVTFEDTMGDRKYLVRVVMIEDEEDEE